MKTRLIRILLLLLPVLAQADPGTVLTGIDVLERDEFRQLSGTRIGLLTNHTGITRDGRSSIRLLNNAENLEVVRLFSPEHSLSGKLDIEIIGDSQDASSGIQVVSLYGKVRRPTAEMLQDIDTIVFDIQDIGTRFYTYISTMGNAMIAAADNGVRFVVLDRPNPINGIDVAGPVLDDGLQSFVGFHTIAVRHGMTVGEIALMLKAELKLDLDLQVIKMHGWQRAQFFDDTGLTWINPSPNMRSLTEALLYPGIGLLETTNLSVGRGTATPFEVFGAPWIDGELLAKKLTALGLPGVTFNAIEFTPDASKFVGETCGGIRITINDRARFEPLTTGFAIARQLRLDYTATWQTDPYLRLLGNAATLDALQAGQTVAEIKSAYQAGLETFITRRAAFLLYE
jgi:uncharacterized protein YbbC (DUF1343 family)